MRLPRLLLRSNAKGLSTTFDLRRNDAHGIRRINILEIGEQQYTKKKNKDTPAPACCAQGSLEWRLKVTVNVNVN
jgi:hypothetical protein